MTTPLDLIYEGRGFSGSLDLSDWLADATAEDVASLMGMICGMRFADAPCGLVQAYRDLAGADAANDPDTLLFREQAQLLEVLRADHPLLWEAASGQTLHCDDTIDMFGGNP